jgi:hypothetical protein
MDARDDPLNAYLAAFRQASEDYRRARLDVIQAGIRRAILAAQMNRSGLGYGALAKHLGVTKSRAQQLCNRGNKLIKLADSDSMGVTAAQGVWQWLVICHAICANM